jgi:hypothetical protein
MSSNDTKRTRIVGGTIIAFRDGAHRILEDGVLVFEGNQIVHVGRSYDGLFDETLNAAGKLVIPGFISGAYRKSNPAILVMQSAEDRAAKNTPCALNITR